jgi:hypothetical protein
MADAVEARAWLTENLTSPGRCAERGGDYYLNVASFLADLPDDHPDLTRVAALLITFDHGDGRRPDISLNGDDEDTTDVLAEVLDDDVTTLDSGDGTGIHGGAPLSRESYATFLHELIDAAAAWLASDGETDRFAS